MDLRPPVAFPVKRASFSASNDAYGTSASAVADEPVAPRDKVHEIPKFDLEQYIENYTGRTRFNRLYFIGTTSTVLAADALRLAIAEAKSGKDVKLYEKAVRAFAEVAPGEEGAFLDSVWLQNLQKSVKAHTDRLEHELRGYKNNLIKESIRMGNEDLGNHYYETGDLWEAAKSYTRMRDYCTTPNHIESMLFKLMAVSIERFDWVGVEAQVHRLQNNHTMPDVLMETQPKVAVSLALAQMKQGSYLDAAKTFMNVPSTPGDETYNDVISANDVAVYGGLCALASMDRNELQARVLDNSTFRPFLELEPHIRRAVVFFCNSKFRPCIEILEAYRADYLLDFHLRSHVSELYKMIRNKSIHQYLVPFSKASLDSMAAVFSPAEVGQRIGLSSPFLQELIKLIQDDVLDLRIDLEHGFLIRNKHDLRAEMQAEALENLATFNQELHWRMLARSVIDAGLQVRSAPEPPRRRVLEHSRFPRPGSG
ncbi:hypothetical protein N7466_003152 [Penicillium verhagenii]|uniref:uncharacterized protein n=1 Tax=Penicillium verhagenii TaxID=1562060 RepID=UPI00254586CD|nr:uncharacterized protein N7466_003152 [Penicillium verhagenii]KAJ5936702.1 hypothetical protein N7466_003152 [Penicillium verhagenii]